MPAWAASTPRKPTTVTTAPAQGKTCGSRGAATVPVRAKAGPAAPRTRAHPPAELSPTTGPRLPRAPPREE